MSSARLDTMPTEMLKDWALYCHICNKPLSWASLHMWNVGSWPLCWSDLRNYLEMLLLLLNRRCPWHAKIRKHFLILAYKACPNLFLQWEGESVSPGPQSSMSNETEIPGEASLAVWHSASVFGPEPSKTEGLAWPLPETINPAPKS